MRHCTRCNEDKPIDAFECTNRAKGWYRRECKICVRDRVRGYATRSREEIQRNRHQHYLENKEQIVSRVNEWVKNNPDKRRKNALAYYYRLQHAAILQYGGYKCSWCGIDEPLVLCLDHIENNGNAHRKELGTTGGHKLYKWLRDNEYPAGFQVLCMNCNHAKMRNGGVLPQTLNRRCNDYPERE